MILEIKIYKLNFFKKLKCRLNCLLDTAEKISELEERFVETIFECNTE